MELELAIRERHSVSRFDTTYPVSDDVLFRLFRLVALSPSSFNLQHWRFVVVRDPDRKLRLQRAAHGQKQVGQASAVVVVCGKLGAHRDAVRVFANTPPEVRDRLVSQIEAIYAQNPPMQRDEAIRSASLASMTLMLAAQSHGLDTSPLIGFDPAAVAEIVRLDEEHLPVMLLLIGKEASSSPGRPSDRLPVHETVRLETLDGPGLGLADNGKPSAPSLCSPLSPCPTHSTTQEP